MLGFIEFILISCRCASELSNLRRQDGFMAPLS